MRLCIVLGTRLLLVPFPLQIQGQHVSLARQRFLQHLLNARVAVALML